MADTLTSTSVNNNLLPNYYVPKALIVLYNETPLYEFAEKAPQPQGHGNTTYWNAWVRMSGASSTLAEGGNNSLPALSSRRVSASVSQYGRGHKISDLAEWMSVLNVRDGSQQILQYSAKETLEFICHTGIFKTTYYTQNQSTTKFLSAYMSALASAFCANTGTTGSVASTSQYQFPAVFATSCSRLSAVSSTAPSLSAQLSMYGIRKAVNRLERLNAKPLADGNFVGYTHPNAIHSLRKDKDWEQWHQYTEAGQETMYRGESGRIYRVRFVSSALCPRYAVAAHSCIPVFIFGQQAFGVTEVLGGLQMFVVTGPDSNNPFNTYAQLTYKISGAAAALNPSAGCILWVHEKL